MPSPKSTTNLLKQLRALMLNNKYVKEPLQAYIIPAKDAHFSEYLADCDKYRDFITGFTGSEGTAIVTTDAACLWTDGRYHLQASQQLDSNWILMKDGLSTTPSQEKWLSKALPRGSKIGIDPKVCTIQYWRTLETHLETAGHQLVPVESNLVAPLWADRPSRPANAVLPLALKYTGNSVRTKIDALQEQMKEKGASVLLLTALDDIAWTLNLRGSDIAYNPVFFAYLIVQPNGIQLFLRSEQFTSLVKQHLDQELGENRYKVKQYEEIFSYMADLVHNVEGYVWFSDDTNYALASLVNKKSQLIEVSPVALMKAIKNPVEAKGMKNAHIKDAAALCCYFAWLEKHVPSGKVTEVSGAKKLEEFRSQQEDFVGSSFPTISSVGPHGAIIHYQPSASTDVPITTDHVYLCDSGGQYLDGTTDVTRTMHFGTPNDFEKECFTRVLKCQLKLGSAIFPSKIKGNHLDAFAREFLWEVGLDYAHGTSHGIGAYLNVHEGPMGVSWRPYPNDPGLEANMFLSNEPGYYEDGKFGIRIEDIVQIVEAHPPHNFKNKGYLTFETVTLVPKQTKMITIELLTSKEIKLLNAYHKQCREIIGPLLDKQGQTEAKEWLLRETEPIKC